MFILNNLSSVVFQKWQDTSGMERGTYIIVLGGSDRRTTIFTIHLLYKRSIYAMGNSTVIKQQCLVMQWTNRKDYPYQAAIQNIIIVINKKVKEGHDIILFVDGNEHFINAAGGIVKLYRHYTFFDSLDRKHGNVSNKNPHLCSSKNIAFIFCSFNILETVKKCSMSYFNNITTSDRYGLFLEISRDVLLKY